MKFYAALGNHDEPSQRFYEPFNMDGKRYYTHSHGDVKFFVLDSTYMTPEQLAWLEQELERSNEKWKIPYMHHPIHSSGERHGSERDLQASSSRCSWPTASTWCSRATSISTSA